jgi:glycosyltransferase involved in cell wall biosynthesis
MKISVCVATYNGERFIHQQLSSIVCQLAKDDEIVIVDDASSDATIERIESFRDAWIRIVRHERNCGVVNTFGHALTEARGNCIFLCDQDYIWAPSRVSRLIEAFREEPSVTWY